ncbi:MAG: GGDEF domain-containing protein [Tardiphaga sp.]
MTSAVFALIVNTVVCLLFAATFVVMATSNRSFQRVAWFALAYMVGACTPASEFLVRFTGSDLFVATSFISFVASFYVTAVALTKFYRLPTPWPMLAALLTLSIGLRFAIWGGQRNDLTFEILYQLPFAIGNLLCAVFVFRARPRHALDTALGTTFVVVVLHFLIKPFLATYFGSGPTAVDYASSIYALFSQSSTGILLVCVGLLLVLIVTRAMLAEAQAKSETDSLSGLLNRRGFTRLAEEMLKRADRSNLPTTLLVFDLDHFKRINDTYGHDVGDGFILAFAEILRICAPASAIIARLGGEEFAVMLDDAPAPVARLFGENIRTHLVHLRLDPCPNQRITVSVGAATLHEGSALSSLLKQADSALYRAKNAGRDRVVFADPLMRHPAPVAATRTVRT